MSSLKRQEEFLGEQIPGFLNSSLAGPLGHDAPAAAYRSVLEYLPLAAAHMSVLPASLLRTR